MGKKEGAMTDEKGKQGFGRSAAAFGGIGVGAFLLQLQTATLGRGIRPAFTVLEARLLHWELLSYSFSKQR